MGRTGAEASPRVSDVIMAGAVGMVASMGGGLVSPQAADAATFNRTNAYFIAYNHYQTYNQPFPFHIAKTFGNDYANFVSKVWNYGGGTATNGQWYMYFAAVVYTWSSSWNNVPDFFGYHRDYHYEAGQDYAWAFDAPVGQDWTGASTGDAIIYNWNDGGSQWDHTAVYGGYAYVGSYYDEYSGVTYEFNKYMDLVVQHTSDRVNAPWNIGWLDAKRKGEISKAQGMDFRGPPCQCIAKESPISPRKDLSGT